MQLDVAVAALKAVLRATALTAVLRASAAIGWSVHGRSIRRRGVCSAGRPRPRAPARPLSLGRRSSPPERRRSRLVTTSCASAARPPPVPFFTVLACARALHCFASWCRSEPARAHALYCLWSWSRAKSSVLPAHPRSPASCAVADVTRRVRNALGAAGGTTRSRSRPRSHAWPTLGRHRGFAWSWIPPLGPARTRTWWSAS